MNAINISQHRPAQRLASKFHFDDEDMDLFFLAATSYGPGGGLEIGQCRYVASQIVDGDADSWVNAFANYGEYLSEQAEAFLARGWRREAGETRLKAFASFRSSWQFAPLGGTFETLFNKHQAAFVAALRELELPATHFQLPWAGGQLPGVYLQNERPDAPVLLVIGGADTCHEDLFLSVGRKFLERGYSVAMVDLPGQGNTAKQGLHWPVEAEKPIAAVVDLLIERFGAKPGRIALLGMSLGGYFVTRAAGHDPRFATVMASTPFPDPAQLFSMSVRAAMAGLGQAPTAATKRSRAITFWKIGARTPEEFLIRSAGMRSDPSRVTVPFLSVLGSGDSGLFAAQARDWHANIRSARKSFVELDARSGADGHVQVNNRLRLVQECCGWMSDIFGAR